MLSRRIVQHISLARRLGACSESRAQFKLDANAICAAILHSQQGDYASQQQQGGYSAPQQSYAPPQQQQYRQDYAPPPQQYQQQPQHDSYAMQDYNGGGGGGTGDMQTFFAEVSSCFSSETARSLRRLTEAASPLCPGRVHPRRDQATAQ